MKNLLVIALSARPYAEAAARSGFCVSVIDGFADVEVNQLAKQMFTVPFDADGFDRAQLESVMNEMSFGEFVCVYGSGIESYPDLLHSMRQKFLLLGNSAYIVEMVKSPSIFFAALETLSIPYPKIALAEQVMEVKTVLVKSMTGSGGHHIRFYSPQKPLNKHEYLQEYIEGESISVLFLAEHLKHQHHAHVIGFNQQWVAPTSTQPFRFGGIASQANLETSIKKKLIEIVRKISQHFELVGLNSLDVVIKNSEIYVLEINPRLSASLDLYAKDWLENFDIDLFGLHIDCCSQKPMDTQVKNKLNVLLEQKHPANAMEIIYAEHDILLNTPIHWPDFVKDIPVIDKNLQNKPVKILQGNPICTVISYGNTALSAICDLKTKVSLIRGML
jgi:predicted ATP-grasp superfamily ATP-dependent carboligase